MFKQVPARETMTTIVQVEYRPSLLSEREEILQTLGHPVVAVLGSRIARNLDLADRRVGVVVIGHGAPWEERRKLIVHFRKTLPGVSIVALLRRRDIGFDCCDFNCPSDDPALWIKMVNQALAGIS